MLQKINRGDVYFYDFGQDFKGSIEGKRRPCVIVSNDMGNKYGTTAIVAPITTRDANSCKSWQVHYTVENRSQVILLEQLRVVNIDELEHYQGRLNEQIMKEIDIALAIELDLNTLDREVELSEFLRRLDKTLVNIVDEHLTKYDSRIDDIVSKAIADTTIHKQEYDRLCEDVISKINSCAINDELNDTVKDIKSIFNKSAENIDKMLTSLINLYKNVNSKEINTELNINKIVDNCDDNLNSDENIIENVENNQVSNNNKNKRYTLEFAKTFVNDYYAMSRDEFMAKYELKDAIMVSNRMMTMKKILKRHNVDYTHIKNNVKVYNINDLSDKEKEAFSKYFKDNKMSKKSSDSIFKKENAPKINNANEIEGRCKTWQPRINYENVQELLDFIDDCNKNTTMYICNKYNLTQKQLSNRKYLITKSLKERNIPFTIIKKSRKDS